MLNLVTDTKQEEIIKAYLEKNASQVLQDKINNGKKTLAGFFQYAKGLAKKEAKDGVACIEDKVVFGWAIHYFEEDSIKEGDIPKHTPKKEAAKKEDPAKKAESKKEVKQTGTQQLSLFDL